MVVFGIITKNDSCIEPFFNDKMNKSREDPILKNIFISSNKTILLDNNNLLTVLSIDFVFNFPFYYLGDISLLSVFFLFGFHWYLIIPGLLSATRLLWSSVYYHNGIKKGLLKRGYNDSVAFIHSNDIVRKVLL